MSDKFDPGFDMPETAEQAVAVLEIWSDPANLVFSSRRAKRCADLLRAVLAQEAGKCEPVAYFDKHAPSSTIAFKWKSNCSPEQLKRFQPVFTYPVSAIGVVPDGWKLVPVEPTELMIRRGDQNYSWSVAKIYAAMIADAPTCLDKVKELNQ